MGSGQGEGASVIADPNVLQFPSDVVSPEKVLGDALARSDIKAVVIITMDEKKVFEVVWSRMTISDLCMASRVLDLDINESLKRE